MAAFLTNITAIPGQLIEQVVRKQFLFDIRRRSLIYFQVIMATNRIDILDPALLRPGRIDRKVQFMLFWGHTRREVVECSL